MSKSFLFIGIGLLLSCGNKYNKTNEDISRSEKAGAEVNYQKIIDSLDADKFYNETKWLMYCIHCDMLPEWRESYSHLIKRPCSFLDLKPGRVEKKDSIIKIWCDFYYNDTLSYDINTVKNYPVILDGVEFNVNSGSHKYLSGTSSFVEVNPVSRYDNELQNDVVQFINQNKDSLHPWFRNEAKKRGVLKN